jgi:hypothetical protein
LNLAQTKISKIEGDSFKGIEQECIVDLSFSTIKTLDVAIPENITVVFDFNKVWPFFYPYMGDEDVYLEEMTESYLQHIAETR